MSTTGRDFFRAGPDGKIPKTIVRLRFRTTDEEAFRRDRVLGDEGDGRAAMIRSTPVVGVAQIRCWVLDVEDFADEFVGDLLRG